MNEILAALVTGIAALIGVIIGGLISWLTSQSLEQRRWQREDSRRFEVERKAAYASLLGSIANFIAIPKDVLQENVNAKAEWLKAQAEIQLLASPNVQRAAHGFSMVVSDHVFNPNPPSPQSDWFKTRQDFIDAVREELGLPVSFFSLTPKKEA